MIDLKSDHYSQRSQSPNKQFASPTKTKKRNVAADDRYRSSQYNGFNEQIVNNEHIETLQEIARQEREVADSVKEDNKKLTEQLTRANQRIALQQ